MFDIIIYSYTYRQTTFKKMNMLQTILIAIVATSVAAGAGGGAGRPGGGRVRLLRARPLRAQDPES